MGTAQQVDESDYYLDVRIVSDSDADIRHHTVVDTFDKVDPRWLALDTAALALAAWSLASADQPPGRRLPAIEVKNLLAKTRQLEYVGLDYPSLPRATGR